MVHTLGPLIHHSDVIYDLRSYLTSLVRISLTGDVKCRNHNQRAPKVFLGILSEGHQDFSLFDCKI